MYLDIQSAVLPVRSQGSLPALSVRANSTDRIKSYGKLTGLFSQNNEPERMSIPTKAAMSFSSGRTSRASSISKQDSIAKLYEKVNANLLGKINESVLSRNENSIANLKEKQLEAERQRKNLAITFLRTADTFGHFLEPYTTEFIQTVEQSRAEINFNINDPTEDDLNVFIEQQSNIAAVAKKVLDDCVVGKILAKKGLEELGKVLSTVIDTLIAKYTKVLQACKPQLRAKNLLSEQKEQQAMLVTKNEKTLFESIRLVNFLHNPLFTLDERMRHKYIDNLVKNKQFLRESKTSFRIEVVNNFEEDLKKLGKVYIETKSQNEILIKENAQIKKLLDEMNGRYVEDQKLLKFKNQQLIKKRREQQENGENKSRSRSPSDNKAPVDSILLTLQQEKDRNDDLNLLSKQDIDELYDKALIAGGKDAIRQKHSKAADSQTFVITYLEKELRSLEAELQRSKQDVERLKTEKNIMARKLQDHDEAEIDKKLASKEIGIQCAFLSEKEGYVEVESTLEKIIKGKDPLKITAVEHDEEWLLLMINMVYQEKFQADMQDDFDGKSRKSLAQFCKEWFLNRFGFQQAAEVMMRDFLKTLSKFVQKHPRYKTFGMLIGLSDAYDIKLPETINNSSKEDTKVAMEYFKRQFLMSHYGISIFNKAVLLAKSSRCAAQFDTFLPDIHNPDDDGLEIKGLVAVLRDLLVLLEIPSDDMKQILGQFDLMVEGDAYFKMIEKQFEKDNAKLNIQDEIEKGLSVRMDYYLLFVLENTAACFVKDLEQVYMQIRLTNEFVNHANVTVDIYRDAFTNLNIEKSQRWFELTYEILMRNDIKHAPPLFQTFGQLAPYVIEKVPQNVKGKLPEDGYPLFQCSTAGQYNDKDVKERIKRYTDLEGNYRLLRVTYQFVKASLSKYQKRAGNVDYLNDLLEKDMNSIKTAMANLKFTHRQGEKEKIKNSLELNWRRLRMIIRARHFIPKEQQG